MGADMILAAADIVISKQVVCKARHESRKWYLLQTLELEMGEISLAYRFDVS
jgi:hypothetical protein